MDGTCLAAGTVAGEGSFPSGEGTSVEAGVSEDLVEFGWSAEVDSRGCFKKIVCGGNFIVQKRYQSLKQYIASREMCASFFIPFLLC